MPGCTRKECGLPTTGQARQEDEAAAIRGSEHGPLDLATEDDQLLSEEGILGEQFRLRPGQIAERPGDRRTGRRLEERQETLPRRAQQRSGASPERSTDRREHGQLPLRR